MCFAKGLQLYRLALQANLYWVGPKSLRQVDGRMSDLLSSDPWPLDAHCVPTIQILCNMRQNVQMGWGGAKRPKQDVWNRSFLLLDIWSMSTVTPRLEKYFWLSSIPAFCLITNYLVMGYTERSRTFSSSKKNPNWAILLLMDICWACDWLFW